MKKIFLTHVLLLLNVLLFANAVSLESAQKTAVIFFRHVVSDKSDYSISDVQVRQENGVTTFYIFNFTSGGFIIVSADDAALPVLGYSERGTYHENNLPVQMNDLLNDYSAEITSVSL